MRAVNANLLRQPLFLLAFGFMLQMCSSNSGQSPSTDGGTSTTGTGAPDGGRCSADGDCELPPSRCSQDRTALLYYTSPSCTNGTCSWLEQQIVCPCDRGGCVGTGTAGGTSTAGPGSISTAGPTGFGGFGGFAGQGGAGGLGERDASDEADAADAAQQACGSPNDCALPQSYCKDAETLVFAQQVMCTAHLCEYAFSEMKCPCSGNGCVGTRTR
jgi:hypothetical protein